MSKKPIHAPYCDSHSFGGGPCNCGAIQRLAIMKKISKLPKIGEGLRVNIKNLISMDELVKENRRLTKQNKFLSKQNTYLKQGLNPMASFDLINRVGDLTQTKLQLIQRCRDLERDLESELTYRDWDNLKEEVSGDWNDGTVKKLNDWIKNSSNPLRYELLLEYIQDVDIPAFQRLEQKARVKLELLERGLSVGRETMPENMIGFTSDPPRREWRDILKEKMDEANPEWSEKIKAANPVMSKSVIRRLTAQTKPDEKPWVLEYDSIPVSELTQDMIDLKNGGVKSAIKKARQKKEGKK